MSKVHDLENCPVAVTVNLIGNKWKLLILRNLFKKSYRFNELKKSLKEVSAKVLTQNLKEMVSSGIIDKIYYDEKILHTEYKLTKLGESMYPIIKTLEDWGIQYSKSK